MRIDSRILPTAAARDALAADPGFASAVDLDRLALELDVEGELFEQLIAITRDTAGSTFFPMLHFDGEELAEAALFQPLCRKVARETDRDYRLNSDRLKQVKPVRVTEEYETRLLDRVALSKITLAPLTIARVGDWTTEYVASRDVVERFRSSHLTGLEAAPVFNPRTKADHDDYLQLKGEGSMPPLLRDGTVRLQRAEKGPETSFRQLGCLSYSRGASDGVQDFNRTEEPFTFFGGPEWVVSARVKQVYEENALEGWEFLPILEEGDALHRKFLSQWDRLRASIGANPKNVL